ncbi:hypothetical protein [Lactobacillus acetotolerans]|uniref:hypothetical protein n=1 Tax=Lactobacillus acetotolerans TaxID=1600 RepID=UPI002FD8C016
MKKVEFNESNAQESVVVFVDGDKYGVLTYDYDQGVWVLWPDQIDDGVSYFDSLKETEEAITDEIQYQKTVDKH